MTITTKPETVAIRFTLDPEFPIQEYIEDGIIPDNYEIIDGNYVVTVHDVDEALIETLRTDEIAEFLGIETEFVTYCEVLS